MTTLKYLRNCCPREKLYSSYPDNNVLSIPSFYLHHTHRHTRLLYDKYLFYQKHQNFQVPIRRQHNCYRAFLHNYDLSCHPTLEFPVSRLHFATNRPPRLLVLIIQSMMEELSLKHIFVKILSSCLSIEVLPSNFYSSYFQSQQHHARLYACTHP